MFSGHIDELKPAVFFLLTCFVSFIPVLPCYFPLKSCMDFVQHSGEYIPLDTGCLADYSSVDYTPFCTNNSGLYLKHIHLILYWLDCILCSICHAHIHTLTYAHANIDRHNRAVERESAPSARPTDKNHRVTTHKNTNKK